MPVGDEAETMLSGLWPQWLGIWRPPEAGSIAAPTASYSIFGRRDAELEAERAVAIVEVEPVVGGPEHHARGVSTASWPAPEIWKKILFCRLSWISLSSSRRDRSIVRYAPTSWSRDSPAALLRSARVWVAMRKPTRVADTCGPER